MLLRLFTCLFLLLATAAPTVPAGAVEDAAATRGSVTGLPLPRFVSVKAGTANLRAGPGQKYPVRWVYQRRHLPVLIIGEHDNWREIRDPWGDEGWLHAGLLSGRRTAMVREDLIAVRDQAADAGAVVMYLERRVIVTVESCQDAWCRINVDGRAGWLPVAGLFGAE
ncbi:MAG: SH3 domain-containing protein [Minwuia sp.]|nr:SH3 domain-containing protein [Minwuia sp.]